jgi:hypothetical protein
MISLNLNEIRNPMVREFTKPHRVSPIQASPQLQDCTQQKASQNGERESATKKQTESVPKPVEEEQESTPLCESYLRGEPCEPNITDAEMFGSMREWLSDIDNIHALEDPLYSDHLQVAGTVDCIAEFQGKLAVIDFKTSSKPKDRDDIHNYFMQTAAYAVAFEERTGIPVGSLIIIMGVDNDFPRLFIEKRDNWIAGFKKLRLEYKHKFAL